MTRLHLALPVGLLLAGSACVWGPSFRSASESVAFETVVRAEETQTFAIEVRVPADALEAIAESEGAARLDVRTDLWHRFLLRNPLRLGLGLDLDGVELSTETANLFRGKTAPCRWRASTSSQSAPRRSPARTPRACSPRPTAPTAPTPPMPRSTPTPPPSTPTTPKSPARSSASLKTASARSR